MYAWASRTPRPVVDESSSPIRFNARLTIVLSRKTTPDATIAARSVHRCPRVTRAVSHGRGYARAMPGPIALVGSGEFLPAMTEVDQSLLAATGRSRPRVA